MQEYVTYNQEENYSIEIGTKKKKGDKISRQGHKNRHYKWASQVQENKGDMKRIKS